ncbi:uncharacterized protein LOC134788539 [Penaeus indicus]|uniref:uncharacterized protein LOC134771576 n=1 Tax=Penaeus indicus TaxID=29960 RepID=UPI00300C6B90
MAPRFSWFLFPLLALLFCHGAAFAAETLQKTDIKTLQNIAKMECLKKYKGKQHAVLYLTGKELKDLKCHQIAYYDARNVSANCNIAPVFNVTLRGSNETFKHSEWQLIYTALRPMLQEWQANNSVDLANPECPKSLYLYSYLAPDYALHRKKLGRTCTHAIVTGILNILYEKGCNNKTRIVVGFSKVNRVYLAEACDGYKLMKQNNIKEYHLESTDKHKKLICNGVIPNAG